MESAIYMNERADKTPISMDEITKDVNEARSANYGTISDCRDAKDNMILEAAVYGNADYLITGDEDLLTLNPYRWIKILNPTGFIKLIYGIE
ncbi:MAG: putative toxin-antitoxin system toxin component, PIN family [Thermacetogeniaceae bacterium]